MRRRLRSIIVAAYLLLCILLGGSAQGVWTNLALQLFGIALIAWAAIAPERGDDGAEKPTILYGLLGLAALVVLVQLVPLPPSVWTELPGRSSLATAMELVEERLPALPLSLTPYQSVLALFALIPALAIFVATKMLRPSPRWLAAAIVVGTTLSIALGAMQVAGGRNSWAYLYPITNTGAVGVFANRNHMGTLLLVAIPFATALLISFKGERGGSAQARWTIGTAALVLAIVGIALNGSLAVLALALPVLAASAPLVPAARSWRAIALPLAAVALVGGIGVLASTPITTTTSGADGSEISISSRQEIWSTTSRAIGDSFPAGTGLGSFQQVYQLYEDPAAATPTYVNHAHNDYLELVLELGAPGLLLLALFLAWWALSAIAVWRSPLSTPFERAATIASAAVLAHSAVDYPLRTAAIAAIFAFAIALMARPVHSGRPAADGEDRLARHVKLG